MNLSNEAGMAAPTPPWAGFQAWPSATLAGLATSLARGMEEREVASAFKRDLADVNCGFAHLSLKGVRGLTTLVQKAAANPAVAQHLRAMAQYVPRLLCVLLQEYNPASPPLVPSLMRLLPPRLVERGGSLNRGTEPSTSPKSAGPAVDAMLEHATLKLLQGLFLVEPASRAVAAQAGLVEVLLGCLLNTSLGDQTREACLDVLLCSQLGNSGWQAVEKMRSQRGASQVASLLLRRGESLEMRKKLAEFLVLIMTHVRPALARDAHAQAGANANKASSVDLPALDDGLGEVLGKAAMDELSYELELSRSSAVDVSRVLNERIMRLLNTSRVQQAIAR